MGGGGTSSGKPLLSATVTEISRTHFGRQRRFAATSSRLNPLAENRESPLPPPESPPLPPLGAQSAGEPIGEGEQDGRGGRTILIFSSARA
jgi:hypothetical protein